MKKILLASALLLISAPTAFAQMVVIGDGDAALCYKSAKMGNMGSVSAIRTCSDALDSDVITRRDEAATYVNRGVLLMRGDQNSKAEADFLSALAIQDDLPEAHINHGVALFKQDRFEAALVSYETALSLDAEDELAALALYNRALVHERLGNTRQAYYDFRDASEAKPEWDAPREAMTRFTVTRRASS